jgi:hypothetical protein
VSGAAVSSKYAVFKYRENSISEIFGLQLALALGLPIPRWAAIWTSQDAESSAGPGRLRNHPYRVGVLVPYLPRLQEIDLETLATYHPRVAAAALVLQLFNRFEPVQYFLDEERRPVLLDFEPLLASLPLDHLMASDSAERDRALHLAARNFEIEFDLAFSVDTAKQLGVGSILEGQLTWLMHTNPADHKRWVSVDGHPLADMLSRFSTDLVTARVGRIRESLEF